MRFRVFVRLKNPRRELCFGVNLIVRGRLKHLMQVLCLNKSIDSLAMAYSVVLILVCVEQRVWSCLGKGIMV